MRSGDAVVVGDLNIDVFPIGQLASSFLDPSVSSSVHYSNLTITPGGTSFNIAQACVAEGLVPCICGAIGDDFAGNYLKCELDNMGIAGSYKYCSEPTGIAVLVWDSQGKRLVLNSDRNANHDLDSRHLLQCLRRNPSCKFLFINGYSLRRKETTRYTAITEFLRRRDRALDSLVVVFDLAPHNLYEVLPTGTFNLICAGCDALSFEVSTIRRFLKLGERNEQISDAIAIETLAAIRTDHPHLSLLGFFGSSACGRYVRMLRTEVEPSYGELDIPMGSAIKGLSDRIMVREFVPLRA